MSKEAEKGCGVCGDFKTWSTSQRTKASNTSTHGLGGGSTGPTTDTLPCPPDSQELGSSTWTFLHTMASYYPDRPSMEQKEAASALISSLSKLYPCSYCAHHMRGELKKNPANVDTRSSLEKWMCDLHNEVNERLGKPVFDCSRVRERWKDGGDNCDT